MLRAVLVLGGTLGSILHAQEKVDANEVLRRVAETYAKAERYHIAFSGRIQYQSPDGGVTEGTLFSFEGALAKPDKVRFSVNTGGYTEPMTITSNGTVAWIYFPKRNEYMKAKPGPVPGAELSEGAVNFDTMIPWAMQSAQKVLLGFGTPVKRASILREEKLAAADCYVLRMENGRSVTTRWVDRRRLVVLRDDETTDTGPGHKELSSTVYSTVKIDEPLSESLFTFIPPEGAKLVDRINQ